jgi:hypothetical protein
MSEREGGEGEQGQFAVPGPESHEAEESLSPDERAEPDQAAAPPVEPRQPAAKPASRGLWARIKELIRPG